MIRQNQNKINIVHVLFDTAVIVFSFFLASIITGFFNLLQLLLFVFLHIFFYHQFRFYKSYRISRFINDELRKIVKACLSSFITVQTAVFFLSGNYEFVIMFEIINFFTLVIYKYALRKILKFLRSKGYNLKYLIIVGKNKCTENFINKIEEKSGYGYRIAGIFGDKSFKNITYLGEIPDLECFLENESSRIDEIVISVEDNPELLKNLTDKCDYHGVKFTIILDIFAVFNDKFYIYEFDNILSVSTYNIPLESLFNYMIKRAFDIIVSALSLIILLPFMLTVAAIIKFTSKGSAILKQKRMGLNKREFYMYKFRSMNTDSSELIPVEKGDARVTKVGRFIRKYGIDEFPQIFNVLKGEMSLVGPRPELPFHANRLKEGIPLYMVKHYVKPGITGWAQVNGLRGNTSIEERIKYDIFYIENWSLWLDVKIIFLTFYKGVFNENAY